ncbi:MAG: xylC, partial [Acidimicrobiaceae bacterium]|nr:xylC [Acidimicrobiaceae bacterium]
TPDMPVCHEEITGPLAAVLAFDGDEQAVALANRTSSPFLATVCSGSTARARAVGARIQALAVGVSCGGPGRDGRAGTSRHAARTRMPGDSDRSAVLSRLEAFTTMGRQSGLARAPAG